MDEKLNALLMKARKGAVAGFNFADVKAVLGALGFLIEEEKEGRKVVKAVACRGDLVVSVVKPPSYRRLPATELLHELKRKHKFNLDEEASKVLGVASYDAEMADRVQYGVAVDLSHAGCCPACFRIQKLDDKDLMVLHGYERPGGGYIVGSCFGVGLKPLEVSSEGVERHIVESLRPQRDAAVEARNALRDNPPSELSISEYDHDERRYVGKMIGRDHPSFPRRLEEARDQAERAAQRAQRILDGNEALVAGWVPDIAPIERREKRVLMKLLPLIRHCL